MLRSCCVADAVLCLPRRHLFAAGKRHRTSPLVYWNCNVQSMLLRTSNCLFSLRRGSHLSGAFLNKGDINSREIAQTQRAAHTCKTYRFNEMCVLGGGEISGSRCDVASSWCLSCFCFLQLMLYREFFMDTMQMVVAIPLCFGSFSFVTMEFVHHWCPVVLGQLGLKFLPGFKGFFF